MFNMFVSTKSVIIIQNLYRGRTWTNYYRILYVSLFLCFVMEVDKCNCTIVCFDVITLSWAESDLIVYCLTYQHNKRLGHKYVFSICSMFDGNNGNKSNSLCHYLCSGSHRICKKHIFEFLRALQVKTRCTHEKFGEHFCRKCARNQLWDSNNIKNMSFFIFLFVIHI